ncbi:arylsulfatase [Actinophytocola xinjiangensis]|uniref:Arylsulfatase n=1 Tax=Actinophytocola xinjiangensis TaxID=485602 RepID=A0A7Z1B0W1_9PSEU|nr:sulfatase-like hydrolase/transferase [Actinophytocola xinjiangensis]OLF14050.1 arylsulfatase [Actinophytocola xinjiangensis]
MPDRPNVIVFLTDQQRWDTTGVHGNPLDLTPTFDRMATTGTHAVHAVTPQPVCAPARAALQTGRYPTATGCFRNGIPLPAAERTLAHEFADAGYATGYLGKWHLAAEEPVPPDQRGGYQRWLAANLLEFTSDAYRTVMFDDRGDPVALPGYRSDAITDAAIRFVADHHDRPFFLFVSYLEPHHQNEVDCYPAPEGYARRYAGRWLPPDVAALRVPGDPAVQHLAGYCGQVRRLDEGLGRLRDALRSMALSDNTILAYTSDHGCHFRTRNAEYKRSCHDGSLRVPLALCGPGFDGGRRIEEPVSTLDLPPTLLAAAGIEVPERMQGRSLLAADRPAESFFQVSESEVGRGIRTARWKYYAVAPDADPWEEPGADRYVEYALHDLDNDPAELTNLAGLTSHRRVADELRERLVRRMVEAGEAAPVIEPAAPRTDGQRQVDPTVRVWDVHPTRFGHQSR